MTDSSLYIRCNCFEASVCTLQKLRVDWVVLLLCIWWSHLKILIQEVGILTKVFRGFPYPFRANDDEYFRLDHSHFHPQLFNLLSGSLLPIKFSI
jgi:hypothetical protein